MKFMKRLKSGDYLIGKRYASKEIYEKDYDLIWCIKCQDYKICKYNPEEKDIGGACYIPRYKSHKED